MIKGKEDYFILVFLLRKGLSVTKAIIAAVRKCTTKTTCAAIRKASAQFKVIGCLYLSGENKNDDSLALEFGEYPVYTLFFIIALRYPEFSAIFHQVTENRGA